MSPVQAGKYGTKRKSDVRATGCACISFLKGCPGKKYIYILWGVGEGCHHLSLSATFHWPFSRDGQLVAIISYANDLPLVFSLILLLCSLLVAFSFISLILSANSAKPVSEALLYGFLTPVLVYQTLFLWNASMFMNLLFMTQRRHTVYRSSVRLYCTVC